MTVANNIRCSLRHLQNFSIVDTVNEMLNDYQYAPDRFVHHFYENGAENRGELATVRCESDEIVFLLLDYQHIHFRTE